MPIYKCIICNFSTGLKGNLNQHLFTNKHKNNLKMYNTLGLNHEKIKVHKKTIKMNPNESILNPNESILNPNESILNPNESFLNPNESILNQNESIIENDNILLKGSTNKKYVCSFCNKEYSTSSNMHRHMKKCKTKVKDNLAQEFANLEKNHKFEIQKQQQRIDFMEKEKEEMKKHIEILIDKVGDTNITNNTIVLNCYGSENLKHITDSFKTDLLKIPYAMIPKLIEAVHFNEDCPENKNICLPNKNAPYVKVFQGKSWIYKDKKETIKELVDKNYNILDAHYENSNKSLEKNYKERYVEFQDKIVSSDMLKKLMMDVGLVFINN